MALNLLFSKTKSPTMCSRLRYWMLMKKSCYPLEMCRTNILTLSVLNYSSVIQSAAFTNCMLSRFGLKCFILSDCKMYTRMSRCVTAKFLVKQSRRGQRCKSLESAERATSSILIRSGKLKETKRRVSKRIEELKDNVLTIPNALCVLRMAATPILGYLVLQEFYTTSLGIFLFAGCTDVLDGYIARNFPNQQSMIGSFLDPAADKLLVATLFLTLTANGLIPVPLTSLIISRDICLMAAGFYIRYVSLPPPKTLFRYFDMSFATASLSPTTVSKANTLVQLSLAAFSLAAPVFGYVDHFILPVLWYTTAATTLLSAASYVYYKNTYKLLIVRDKSKKLPAKDS